MTEIEQLKAEIERLKRELAAANITVRCAKDITPVSRPSLKRVLGLAHSACLEVKKVTGGWLLKLGQLTRRFRSLKDIWSILIQDNWLLSDIFPPQFQAPTTRWPRRYPVLASHVSQARLLSKQERFEPGGEEIWTGY